MDLRTKDRKTLLTLLAAAAVGVLALDNLVLKPYVRAWNARSEAIATLDQRITRGGALLDRADAMERKWRQMQDEALAGDRSTGESNVLRAVSGWVRGSGIALNSWTPEWKSTEPGHELFEIRLGATGDLEEIARFLFELEQDPLAVKVDDLLLAAQDERGRELSMTLRFSGLRLLEASQ
jgi:hypothetical protein